MSKADTPARIVVARTEAIETLLQELWRLRPELKDRISLTISMAITALVQNTTREKAILEAELANYQQMPAPTAGAISQRQNSNTTMSSTSEPHPDSAWN